MKCIHYNIIYSNTIMSNIKEIEPEKKINISKFNFSVDDVDESIPKPLPNQLNFCWIICGKPGSGKSSLVLNLLCKRGKCYNKKFDRVFIWSPSLASMKDNPFADLPDEQKYMELTEENLEGVLSEIEETGDKVLFVMDDVVNDMKKNRKLETLLCKILMNRRHLCGAGGSVAVIMTSQVYNKIPAPVRKCGNKMTIFHTKNKRELETIFDEMILIPKDDFFKILKHTFQKKHDFLYLDLDKAHNKMFHRNFNQLEFGVSDEVNF